MFDFLITCFIVELTPGPNMGWLAALSLASGRKAGLSAVAGIALGLAAIGLIVALGLAEIVERVPVVYQILRWGGIAWLLWLAFDAWRESDVASASSQEEGTFAFSHFRRGLITNLLNPKAAIFYLALLPTFVGDAKGSPLGEELALVAIYVAVATAVHGMIVLFAARLRPVLMGGAHERLIRRVLALSLAAFAVWFAFTTRAGST
jgi:threonine/homoserine/homoserine lactone efflux protein